MFIHKVTKTVVAVALAAAPLCAPAAAHADVVNPSGCAQDIGQIIIGASLAAGGAETGPILTVPGVAMAASGVASAFQDCAPAPDNSDSSDDGN